MSKKYYRFYGGLLASQERWLNRMSAKGHRLIRTTKAMYEFAPCAPGQYQYKVEFVAHLSGESADDYARFLKGCGYQVFFKNINLNWSIGKVEARPWAEPGGRLATAGTTLHRELLIVEKENDGKSFELHTTYADRQTYLRGMRRPWLFLLLLSAVLGVVTHSAAAAILGAVSLAGLALFQLELRRLKKEESIQEW